ncbi:hypothetical protein CUC43_11610 [Bacillus thuringiensis LM1212]|uniref:hypothetical protein n=1 Tax=Bacillus cereus group TaxID=86661 RepID=UPI000404DBDF|nr:MULTISPECIES: hypothetical protein [Bacillus cereus group]AXY07462.1 hypothetical protein CUC43_11610 [Bacillus thuringiensis LM1212]QDF25843.1 hypothetical protein FJR70_23975 [Bacillus tropicus]QUG93783.1 hypothetical protein HCM98_01915 [Bacillus tropicus]
MNLLGEDISRIKDHLLQQGYNQKELNREVQSLNSVTNDGLSTLSQNVQNMDQKFFYISSDLQSIQSATKELIDEIYSFNLDLQEELSSMNASLKEIQYALQNPNQTGAEEHIFIANRLIELDEKSSALEEYEKAIKLNPLSFPAYYGTTLLYFEKSLYKEALVSAEKSLKRAPDEVINDTDYKLNLYRLMATTYHQLGNNSQSYVCINNAFNRFSKLKEQKSLESFKLWILEGEICYEQARYASLSGENNLAASKLKVAMSFSHQYYEKALVDYAFIPMKEEVNEILKEFRIKELERIAADEADRERMKKEAIEENKLIIEQYRIALVKIANNIQTFPKSIEQEFITFANELWTHEKNEEILNEYIYIFLNYIKEYSEGKSSYILKQLEELDKEKDSNEISFYQEKITALESLYKDFIAMSTNYNNWVYEDCTYSTSGYLLFQKLKPSIYRKFYKKVPNYMDMLHFYTVKDYDQGDHRLLSEIFKAEIKMLKNQLKVTFGFAKSFELKNKIRKLEKVLKIITEAEKDYVSFTSNARETEKDYVSYTSRAEELRKRLSSFLSIRITRTISTCIESNSIK